MNPTHTCPRCGVQLTPGTPPEKCPRCLLELAVALDEGGHATVAASGRRRPAPSPEELAPGFPQLEIEEVLGRGGMGVVYRARQKGLDRQVALKVLHVDDPDPAFAQRFTREARALASLAHPNIVAVHDSGVTDGRYWLLMEYVDGADLRTLIRSGEVRPAEALGIVSQLCEALHYAHEQGVVHRDIKPENILVDRAGRVKIADFGLAKLLRRAPEAATLTGADQAMGTYHYMAPEQLERPLEVDHRADIYSMGVVFYELLTGELPIGRFAPPSSRIGVDVRLDDVVLRSLEKEPRRRYQHASEVKTRVDQIRDGEPPQAPPAHPDGGHHWHGRRREPRSAVGVLATLGCLFFCLVAAGGLALLFLTGTRVTREAQAVAAEQRLAAKEDALEALRHRIDLGEVAFEDVTDVAARSVDLDPGAPGAAAFLALIERAGPDLRLLSPEARRALNEELRLQARRLEPTPERDAVYAALAD